MPMPEATMDENYHSVLGEDDVWRARQAVDIQPKSKAACMQIFADPQLGARVLSPNARHHARTRLCIYNIHALMMTDDFGSRQGLARRARE